jgi:chromosome segregation ATPase
MSEQRFTDEQLDELLADLSETDPQVRYRSAVASRQDAADAIRQLRERVSLLEGERGRFAHELERINEGGKALDKVIPARVGESKADHLRRVAVEVAALRSQLDEARKALTVIRESGEKWEMNWLVQLAAAALDGHHGEPK